MAAIVLASQEVFVKTTIGQPYFQATGTLTGAPTANQFTLGSVVGSFRSGEAWITIGGVTQGVYISNVVGAAITINPALSAAPAAGSTLEQDVPEYTGPYTTNAATNGLQVDAAGYNGAQTIEIVNTGTTGCTITIEGTNWNVDGSSNPIWYAVGYQQIDGIAAPARAVAAIAVPAGLSAHTYQLLDLYRTVRTRLSLPTATMSITVTFIGVPA